MAKVKFDFEKAGVEPSEIKALSSYIKVAHNMLHEKTGLGSDFLGWVDLPVALDKEELKRVKAAGEKMKVDSEAVVVVGIGGSYLGAKAAFEFLGSSFRNQLPKEKRKAPELYFAGQNISGSYMSELLELLKEKELSVIVISKSGTTTEPALAFRLLKTLMEEKYGKKNAAKRIFAVTDQSRGALKKLADGEGYETFVIPDDVGGRFSVLTPVGLLPLAAAGFDIDAMIKGAINAYTEMKNPEVMENECYKYAAVRNLLLRKGKGIEVLVSYDPRMKFIGEWWKQLYGESEGKEGKGIFPASMEFTTDLHSLGQYMQDGARTVFETVMKIENTGEGFLISNDPENLDGLNFLSGKTMEFVNNRAMDGTIIAHKNGGVPILKLRLEKADEETFGELVYFFEKACGISGYLLGVNPFDQPGVEEYKKNMFALLGKTGYEDLRKQLLEQLGEANDKA